MFWNLHIIKDNITQAIARLWRKVFKFWSVKCEAGNNLWLLTCRRFISMFTSGCLTLHFKFNHFTPFIKWFKSKPVGGNGATTRHKGISIQDKITKLKERLTGYLLPYRSLRQASPQTIEHVQKRPVKIEGNKKIKNVIGYTEDGAEICGLIDDGRKGIFLEDGTEILGLTEDGRKGYYLESGEKIF